MKSLKDLSLNLTEQEYHDYPAWSYSMIARYAREGFSAVAKIHDKLKQNDAMRFGSLFDAMLTKGNGVRDEFVVMDMAVPDAERGVLDYLATITNVPFIEVDDDTMLKAITAVNYQSRWKYDTQLAHLTPYSRYYDMLRSGKTIVSREEWDDAVKMVKSVKTDPFLKEHFKINPNDNKEYIYQAQFKITYDPQIAERIELKIMPDMLEVDHNEKTIRPWDIKTSGMPAYDFADHWVKMRYDIQAALYTDVLQMIINKDEDYRDYTILPYYFMDISRIDMVPVTFEYDPRSISQSDGLTFSSNGREFHYKNYRKLLEEILTYEAQQSVVPSNITVSAPNDLLSILNKEW